MVSGSNLGLHRLHAELRKLRQPANANAETVIAGRPWGTELRGKGVETFRCNGGHGEGQKTG